MNKAVVVMIMIERNRYPPNVTQDCPWVFISCILLSSSPAAVTSERINIMQTWALMIFDIQVRHSVSVFFDPCLTRRRMLRSSGTPPIITLSGTCSIAHITNKTKPCADTSQECLISVTITIPRLLLIYYLSFPSFLQINVMFDTEQVEEDFNENKSS